VSVPTTLVVSNDFPPRIGGIERFVSQVCGFCDDDVIVLTSTEPGASPYDAGLPYEVVRRDRVLLPTRSVAREARALLRRSGASRVVFGAAAPLGLLADDLRRAGAERIVALSHGHETWWARVPGARQQLRRIGREVDALTTISTYTAARLAPALDPRDRHKLTRLPPPVDTTFFTPGGGCSPDSTDSADSTTGALSAGRPPRCIAVGRLVRRKGVDTLLRAWPEVRRGVLGAELVVVGEGPQRSRLTDLARRLGVDASVRFTGGLDPVGVREWLWRSQVFALPMRVQLGGLDAEGLGLAALEAAACGLPVVVGESGGAPETVLAGRSGFVVAPEDPAALSGRLVELLADHTRRAAMGAAGRTHVEKGFGAAWARMHLRALLALD
jgi:phosphatidyl-myo-inositol dimannoside synthase